MCLNIVLKYLLVFVWFCTMADVWCCIFPTRYRLCATRTADQFCI